MMLATMTIVLFIIAFWGWLRWKWFGALATYFFLIPCGAWLMSLTSDGFTSSILVTEATERSAKSQIGRFAAESAEAQQFLLTAVQNVLVNEKATQTDRWISINDCSPHSSAACATQHPQDEWYFDRSIRCNASLNAYCGGAGRAFTCAYYGTIGAVELQIDQYQLKDFIRPDESSELCQSSQYRGTLVVGEMKAESRSSERAVSRFGTTTSFGIGVKSFQILYRSTTVDHQVLTVQPDGCTSQLSP